MGLLDAIVGAIGGGGQGGQGGGGGAQLIAMLLQQLGQQGGGAGGNGLGGLVEQFTRGGLGDVVQSWVGSGQNLPVSAQQIEQIFGNGQLAQLAQQFGMEPAQLSQQLADQLPGTVDALTPQGRLPEGGLDDVLGSLSGLFNQR